MLLTRSSLTARKWQLPFGTPAIRALSLRPPPAPQSPPSAVPWAEAGAAAANPAPGAAAVTAPPFPGGVPRVPRGDRKDETHSGRLLQEPGRGHAGRGLPIHPPSPPRSPGLCRSPRRGEGGGGRGSPPRSPPSERFEGGARRGCHTRYTHTHTPKKLASPLFFFFPPVIT